MQRGDEPDYDLGTLAGRKGPLVPTRGSAHGVSPLTITSAVDAQSVDLHKWELGWGAFPFFLKMNQHRTLAMDFDHVFPPFHYSRAAH